MAKLSQKLTDLETEGGPVFTPRFLLAIVLAAVGIAWIAYYYAGARTGTPGQEHGIAFFRDLAGWNYLIGFGLFFLALLVSAHRSTPLGRGHGTVSAMLGCFIVGLAWIVVYYAAGDSIDKIWVFNDLAGKNLLVGIVFMAVGFAFAMRWE